MVDDNASFLAASRAILHGPELSVVGEAATAAEAIERAEELHPDLMLLDIDLGDDSGIELAHMLAEKAGSEAPWMILISAHPEEDYADIVEESPALGFIAKSDLSCGAIKALLLKHGAVSRDGNHREFK
jgi:DNA-binding NarL/FixJ family response regulator